jgi:hypothetical protein
MRLMRCLLVSVSAILAAGALTLAGTTAVTAAPVSRHATRSDAGQPSARFLAKARRALVSYLRTSHPVITLNGPEPGAPDHLAGTSMESSYNWSGYADASSTAGTFSEVGGQWRTPGVLCGSEDQISAQWIGLDGFSSDTVEQDGTISWCFESKATYFTWWEMYPSGSVEVGASVRPGDMIAARVSRTGTSYTLSLADHTHPANSFSVSQSCTSCANTSAEWISERPAFPIGVVPLADYIRWSLSDATETAGGHLGTISSYPNNFKINMIDATDSYRLSVTSPLTGGGHHFATYWLNSY